MKPMCGSETCQAYCYQSHVWVPHVVLNFFACTFIVILLHNCTLHQISKYCIRFCNIAKCCIVSSTVTPFCKCCTTFFCIYKHGIIANQLVYPRQLNSKLTFVSGTKYFVNSFCEYHMWSSNVPTETTEYHMWVPHRQRVKHFCS